MRQPIAYSVFKIKKVTSLIIYNSVDFMEKNEITEEVTVTPIIRDVERLMSRLITGVKKFIIFIWEQLICLLRFVLKHFVIFLIVSIIGGCIGFFSTGLVPREYASEMVLKINVEAKEQLFNDVQYFNALIQRQEHEKLASIFEISTAEAASLRKYEIIAYSSFVERTNALNQLYATTDTSLRNTINTDQLLADNNNELSSKFKITIHASEQSIFQKLEKPMLSYLERVPELQILLKKSKAALEFQRSIYQKEMVSLDTLAKVFNNAMLEQAKSGSISGSDTYISLGNEQEKKTEMNALDIQDRSIFYAQKIAKLDIEIQEHETIYFTTAHLNDYGSKIGLGRLSRAIVMALIFFVLTALILLSRIVFKNKS